MNEKSKARNSEEPRGLLLLVLSLSLALLSAFILHPSAFILLFQSSFSTSAARWPVATTTNLSPSGPWLYVLTPVKSLSAV